MSTIDKLATTVFVLLAAASSWLFVAQQTDYAFGLLVLMVLLTGVFTVKSRHYFGTLRSRAIENVRNSRKVVAKTRELAKKTELANQNLHNELSAASQELQRTRDQLAADQDANIKKTLSTLEALRASTDKTAQHIHHLATDQNTNTNTTLSSLEALRASTDKTAQQIHHLATDQNTNTTLSSLEALRASTDKTAQDIHHLGNPTQQLTKIIWEDTQQLQAYMQLLPRISPRWAMPPLGRWALDAKSMLHLALLIEEHKPKTIVELGSGSSTVWLSYFVEQYGGTVHSFDHLAQYQQQTLQYLKKHELETTASVIEAPLQSYTLDGYEYSWYDLQTLEQIESIDLLIIDGPPGGTNPWARYPALPLLQHKLTPNALVILDDSDRKDETESLRQWRTDNPSLQQKDQGISRLSVLYGFEQH